MEMNTLDELERLLKAGTQGPWETKQNKAGNTTIGPVGYSGFITPWVCDDENAALIVAAINALPGLIESARRVEMSAWTDDDQRGLNAAVADAMWHWDDMPMDCDDATVLTSVLKSSLQDNGFQIVRLATRAQGESS
jgi:hypothetical protein